MTRCNAASKPVSVRKMVCDVTKNGFNTSDSAVALHTNINDEEAEARLLAVIKLGRMNNKSLCNSNDSTPLESASKVQMINCDSTEEFSKGHTPKELFSKEWNSAGVLSEDERPKRMNNQKRAAQVKTKTSARSCDRHSNGDMVPNGKLDQSSCEGVSIHNNVRNGRLQGVCHTLMQKGHESDTTIHTHKQLLNGYNEGSDITFSAEHSKIVSSSTVTAKSEDCHFSSETCISTCLPKTEASDTESQQGEVNYEEALSTPSEDKKENSDTKESSSPPENGGTNLIVNYLPQNMSQEEIRNLFATIGEVDSCKLIRDKSTSQNLGYGFVNYLHSKDAERAIAKLNGLQLQNKTIKVSLARPSSESIKGANLYISGLPPTMSQKELEELFNSCGRIITSRILYDSNTGLSRGVGFIRFDQRAEAEKAIKKLNGVIPENAVEPIAVKLANSPSAVTANSGNTQYNTLGLRNAITGNLNYAISDFGLSSTVGDSLLPEKPGSAAYAAMMLLQQAASQTLDPFSQLTRFPRLPVLPSAGSLLPQSHPFHHHPHRPSRQSMFLRGGGSSSKRLPVPTSSVSSSFQHQQASTHSGPTQLLGPRHSGRFTHSVTSTTTSSHAWVPNLFHNQAHLLPTLHTHSQPALVYPRFRLPVHARPPTIMGPTAGLPLNGFFHATSMPFATFPISEQSGHYPTDPYASCGVNCLPATQFSSCPGFAPTCSDPLSMPNAHPIALGFNTLNFAAPLTHTVSNVSDGIPGYAHPVTQTNGYVTNAPWCLFVCNLPPDTDDATLWRLFGPFGAVRSVKVIREPGTNRCRGFGFVTMANYAEAAVAIHQLNGCLLGSRNIQVTFKLQFSPVST